MRMMPSAALVGLHTVDRGLCIAVSCLLLLFQLVHAHAGSGLNMEVVRVITDELRKRMGLTLFGYDTVVQENTGVLSQHPWKSHVNFVSSSPTPCQECLYDRPWNRNCEGSCVSRGERTMLVSIPFSCKSVGQAILTLLLPGQSLQQGFPQHLSIAEASMIRICCNQSWSAGVHFIIDVNYFPSYKEFPDAAKALSDVLKKALHTQRSQQQL